MLCAMCKSNVPVQQVGEHLLQKVLSKDEYEFTCITHDASISTKAIRVIVDVFFNNHGKYSRSVVTHQIVPFKKLKRTKSSVT